MQRMCRFLLVSMIFGFGYGFDFKLTAIPPDLLDYLTKNMVLACVAPSAKEMNAFKVISLVISHTDANGTTDVVGEVSSFGESAIKNSTNTIIQGTIGENAEDISSLEVILINPSPQAAGLYICEMNVLNNVGHTEAYATNVSIISRKVEANDVAKELSKTSSELEAKNTVLENEIQSLENRVATLEVETSGLRVDVNATSTAVKNQLAELGELQATVTNHTNEITSILNTLASMNITIT